MTDVTVMQERIERLRAEIAALTASPLDAVDGATGPALHSQLRRATDQLQAFAARILARVEADGRWAAGTSRTFEDVMAREELASTGAVRREVALGHALDQDLPGTAHEVAVGGITLAHAQVLARLGPTTPARRAALAGEDEQVNEASLLARAKTMPVNRFRREVDRWAAGVDSGSAEREQERASVKEHLTMARRDDGFALQGFVTHEHGMVLATALRAVAGVPPLGDERSVEQRQAAALVDACRMILDRGMAGGGQQVRPHIDVHVSWETMKRLAAEHPDVGGSATDDADDAAWVVPAELRDGEPIPASLLARIACDSEISRIVFGPRGEVLDVGRAQRTYTGVQRRAVIARDRFCRFPGCGAPVGLGEVHHVIPWSRGGRTSVSNGVLLCWFHHDLVHRRGLLIAAGAGNVWTFTHADGRPIPPPGEVQRRPGTATPGEDTAPSPEGSPGLDGRVGPTSSKAPQGWAPPNEFESLADAACAAQRAS